VAIAAFGRSGASGGRAEVVVGEAELGVRDDRWAPHVIGGKERGGTVSVLTTGGPWLFCLLGQICFPRSLFKFELFSSFLFCFFLICILTFVFWLQTDSNNL
jgi:hypothetical protein